ncbi:hypothetical protein ACFYZ4_22945 [Streptomyces sp. NPDC001513]|uniref:hypothetical protein n=1 Tax=Streptomyces sp. NPDC001513 TaxID=3364580 RepID=UPI0036880D0F
MSTAKQNMEAVTPVTASQNRIRQIKSAIKRLSEEGLAVRNAGDASGPSPLMLLHESGTLDPDRNEYYIPERRERPPSILSLPFQFFVRGWVHLLTPSEIRVYLIMRHLAARFPGAHEARGVYLTERDREWLYDISRDVYESHLTLARFGLIEKVENPYRHPDGKVVNFGEFLSKGGVVSPHRFKVCPDSALSVSAFERISKALLNYPPTFSQMVQKGDL